jgi:hypothetical protein
MIIHKHKLIYIHIPKCGGWSVESAFLDQAKITRDTKESFDLFHIGGDKDKTGKYTHMMLSDYDVQDGYKTCALIREPISRAISYYNWFAHTKHLDFLSFCKSLPVQDDWGYMMTRPQIDYLRDRNGCIAIDNIVRLGNHKKFFQKFDIIIPHQNKSKQRKIEVIDEAMDILKEYYSEDFDLWRFEFYDSA